MTPDAELELLLDDVWRRRRPEVLERLLLLGEAVRRIALSAGADRHAILTAAAEAHRLAGAVGSLGFQQPAVEAAVLQRLLTDPGDPLPAETLRTVVQQASRILRSLTAAVVRPRRG